MRITSLQIAAVVEAHHDRVLAKQEAADERSAEYQSLLSSEITRVNASDLWFEIDIAGIDQKGAALKFMAALADNDEAAVLRFIRQHAEKLAAERLAKRGVTA